MKAFLNGVTLAFDDVGSGYPVLLIHGFPLCRRMWRQQAHRLVEAGYRVITPDLRGFGESSAPAGPYAMSDFSDDVAALLDHLRIQRAVIGGMSMGGYVLLNLLERHPGRAAAALFLVTRAGADDEEGRVRRTRMAREVTELGPPAVAGVFENLLFAPGTPARRPELVAEVKEWMETTPPLGLEGGLLAMRDRKDFVPDLPLLDLPALVVGAEQDQAIPPEHARLLARNLPRATLCLIPEAGHMANLEQPEAFNRCLLDFLEGLGLQGRPA